MATSLVFTDEIGACTVTNSKPVPADRFRNWRPLGRVIGDQPVGLGNGITYTWEHRYDYGAAFSLEHIPQTELRKVQRLIRWLQRAENSPTPGTGTVTVNVGDADSHVYECRIWPGFDFDGALEMMDPATLEYRLYLELRNEDANFMVAGWDGSVTS